MFDKSYLQLLIHFTALSLTATLSVWQVIESSKRWWKCRNRFNQVGFVPFNILEPMAHIESPVHNNPPSVRRQKRHPHTCMHVWNTQALIWSFHQSKLIFFFTPRSFRFQLRLHFPRMSLLPHPPPLLFPKPPPPTPHSTHAAYHHTTSMCKLLRTMTKVTDYNFMCPRLWLCSVAVCTFA